MGLRRLESDELQVICQRVVDRRMQRPDGPVAVIGGPAGPGSIVEVTP